MEHYSQTSARSFGHQTTPIHSQARLDVNNPDQQLPSIRDVIPPVRSNTETTTIQEVPSSTRSIMVPYLSSQPTTSMTMAPVQAPVQSQSTMGFNSDPTNQLSTGGLAVNTQLHTPSRTPAEYSSPWSSSSSYADGINAHSTISSQSSSFNGMTQSIIPSDTSDSVFSSSYSLGRQMPENTDESYRWRTGQVNSTRGYNPYVVADRSYTQTPIDYSRYGQSYEPYRSPMGFDGGYRAMDSSPYSVKYGGPLMSYPMLGYPGNANGRRRRGNLPKPITDYLGLWLQEHLEHPYPSDEQKQIFIQRTGLTISQISNWFINARRRKLPALKLKRAKAMQSRK